MLEFYFKYPRVIARLRQGAIGEDLDQIAAYLRMAGYKRASAQLYLARLARFSAYAAEGGCCASRPIPHAVVSRYLQAKPTIAARQRAQAAIGHAKRCCPERFEAENSQRTPDPHAPVLVSYLQHLRAVRCLHEKTCEGQVLVARRMLEWHDEHLPCSPLSELTAKHVLIMAGDLIAACRSASARSSTTSYMRSFLCYLNWSNLNAQDLAQFVPKTPLWRLAHLPPRLAWDDIQHAIVSIDTSTSVGVRDRAIMLLFATTGIRNAELRRLAIDDIRWRAGAIVLRRTKGRHERVVPLLEDAGTALAEYLLRGRPRTTERRVFLSHDPPFRPFSSSGSVSRIVRTRLQQAGIPIKRGGAHLLRHSLATRLVEQRRPIKEIADLLGHRDINSTALYVKVAAPQLVEVALPFPGGAL